MGTYDSRDILPQSITSIFLNCRGKILIFLDSAQIRENCGRYSFIAIDPFLTLVSKNGVIQLGDETILDNPFDVLARELAKYQQKNVEHLPAFQGGVAGF